MVHISKLANHRVEKVEDVVNIGDELEVKVNEIDAQGRINLIRNDMVYENNAPARRPEGMRRPPAATAGREVRKHETPGEAASLREAPPPGPLPKSGG